MTEAIILAGGMSKRMTTNKMVLPFNGKPLIVNTVNTVLPFVSRVIVVTGRFHQAIASLFKDFEDVDCVYNAKYELGMFESIKTGVAVTKEDFLIVPGDLPLIQTDTYSSLLKETGLIRVVAHNGKKGHPLFISHTLKESLLNTPLPHLKAFRDQYSYKVIEVNDPGILLDIDTIEDYQELLKKG